MKLKYTLAAILIAASMISAQSQTARLYTPGSGLSNSQVNSIYQDSEGFVWISTENGLSRFDGMDFSTFRFDKGNRNSLVSDLVLTVLEDNNGLLWVGTSAGLQTFDKEYNTFNSVDLNDDYVPESDQHIADILEVEFLGKDRILAASSGHGIYIIDPDTRTPDNAARESIESDIPPFIGRIYADRSGRLWIGAENGGISVIDLDSGKETADIRNLSDPEIAERIVVTAFAQDITSGNVILGSSSHGILIYDEISGLIRKAKDDDAANYRVKSLLKNNIAPQYGENTFLVGIENNGIKIFDASTESIHEVSLPNVAYKTSTWKVHSLMEDNQGNVWAGAFQTGVLVIPKSMYGFEQIHFSDYANGDGACVTSILENPGNGDLWIGTDGAGLYRIDKDGRKSHFTSSNSRLSNNSIMSLEIDRRGTLWIATYLGGLVKWTPEGGFRSFRDQKALNTERAVCLEYSAKNDILYIGTHGNGMSVIRLPEEKIEHTFSDNDNKWISDLYIDKAGMLWVGTYNGPMLYDHRTGILKDYEIGESLKTRVQSFCESSDGIIWICSGEGLTGIDRNSRNISYFTEDDGLPSNVLNDIQEGNDGHLWISTLNGLSRFNPATKEFKNYYQYDGLQENEFHSRASFKSSDGKLYFGGIKGLTSFYPHIIDQRTHPVPPLYFSDLRVMDEPIEYSPEAGKDNILDKHITLASSITLPNDRNMFSIKFSVLEYTNPMKITYSYMVEGFDGSWNHLRSDSRTVTYTNLPSGKYKMKVKAFFEGEQEDFSYREIDIKVLPPWYRTAVAYIIYIIIGLLAVLVLIQWKKRVEIRKKEQEESEIKELKLKMFTNISHEIRTPLTLVMNPLKKMREAEKDPKQKELYNLMYRNSLRILRLVNQLLDMRKIDNGQMQLHFLETDVIYFIRDIMKSFDNLAVSRNISLSITPQKEITNLWIDQGNFDKIIFNILSNAFKYTPENGSVSIHISDCKPNEGILDEKVNGYVEIVIENSGSAVEERFLDKVFDRFFQADILDAKVGSGVGLNLTKMLVELHHGDIRAYNTDEGVAFSIRIPVGCAHLSSEEMTKPTNHKDLYTKNPMAEHSSSREDVTYMPSPAKEEKSKQAKSKKNIVLVDDDSEMRAYLKLELQSLYNVEACASGKDAWSKITTSIPDAVITDLMMKGMDGAALCEKVKKNPATNHIPVIILTSSSDESSQQRCMDSGADRFFTKPVSLEILKSNIANAISTIETIKNKYNKDIDYRLEDMQMPDSSDKLVKKVIDVIRQNIDNTDFTVEDLSKEIGMSRVHLNRKLKELMNTSPSNLIRSIRLKQAAYLLINKKVNVSEVAYKVGFSTHSYFSNSFHDFFGMTPKEFVARYIDCKDEEILKKIFD